MSVILQLREDLNRLKQIKLKLTLSADASIRAAKELLASSAITQLHDIDLKTAAQHLSHAIEDQDSLAEVMEKIRRVERELGHG